MNKLVSIIIPLVFLATACNQPMAQSQTKNVLTIGSTKLDVQLAKTQAEQQLGLGLRDSLPEDAGMLFVFMQPKKQTFWMKDMRFPLDFIWISNGKITEITPDAAAEASVPDSSLKLYAPANSVDQVLEVNAGWAKRHNIKVGDSSYLTIE